MKQVKLLKKVKQNSKKLILAKGNQNNLFHTDLNNRSSMQSDRESLKLSIAVVVESEELTKDNPRLGSINLIYPTNQPSSQTN